MISESAMSYEEPQYKIIIKTEVYEVRLYAQRTVAQVLYSEENSGFKTLFNYISGANEGSKQIEMTIPVTQAKKIEMTVPVTQSVKGGTVLMQFFLPKQYDKDTAPTPTDPVVKIIDLPESYYAVISYSGLTSEKNFEKHYKELENALAKDGIKMSGSAIKATYNSPFTLPFLRRNEAMFPLDWD